VAQYVVFWSVRPFLALGRRRAFFRADALCLGALLAILLTSSVPHKQTKRLAQVKAVANSFLRFLGKCSYGMNVVQLPLVNLLPLESVVAYFPTSPIGQSLLYLLSMFSLITAIAVLSFPLLESHFLRLKKIFH